MGSLRAHTGAIGCNLLCIVECVCMCGLRAVIYTAVMCIGTTLTRSKEILTQASTEHLLHIVGRLGTRLACHSKYIRICTEIGDFDRTLDNFG